MNIFTFTGNLGKDCEVKYLPSGKAVCTFSVAVKSGYGDNVKTSWPRCTIFGKRAEGGLPQYLKKGAQVCISGELSLDEWQGQDGTTQKMLSVNVREVDLIGAKDPQQSATSPPSAAQPAAQGNFQEPEGFDSDLDIPF
jgi:single-strand DNA-binding protein